MALQQKTRLLNLHSPLGDDVLLLTAFSGNEEISRPFLYHLDMISDNPGIEAKKIVGKDVTFSVDLGDGSQRQFYHGFVRQFIAGDEDIEGRREYTAEVVPWLWFLTRTADCRIFQEKTIPEIVEEVFFDNGFTDFDTAGIRGDHKKWEYCVQYRETDFNFVSRLLEQEGIFYFFKHEEGKHTLHLADSNSVHQDLKENEVDYPRDLGTKAITDHLTSWGHQFSFRSGKVAHTDYNFKTPSTSLMATTNTCVQLDGNTKYEVYDYPGEYSTNAEGAAEIRLRMEEEETDHEVVESSSTCRTFNVGGKFKIGTHRSDSEEGKEFVITRISHSATETLAFQAGGTGGRGYSNIFTCVPSSVTIRPARITPKPVLSGVQTAVVVGPSGEEIYCDEYGRIKVQFHWDRLGKGDEKSSCWMRVASGIAGKNWGWVAIPRIGQEVVIDFLEGDPDRPMVVGSVYNAEQMPHYELPAHQNKTYFKTNSTKGGDGFNELMFDDTADEERVFMHAEKNLDMRVKNDSKNLTSGNRHQIIGGEKDGKKGGDQRELVYQDKHLNIKRNQVEHIEGNYQLMIGNGEADDPGNFDIVAESKMALSIGDGGQHIDIVGDKNEKVGGSQSLAVTGDQNITAANIAMEGGQNVHIKGGMNVVIEAGMQLTLKVGGNFVSIGPAGVDIQGIMVNINSGGSAGSGSGSSPVTPEAAIEAAPTEPEMAFDSKTGNKSSS